MNLFFARFESCGWFFKKFAGKLVGATFLFIFLGQLNCSSDDFIESSVLGKLKVLGIVVDQPEIDVATLPVTISAEIYLSDLNGAGRAVSVSVESCFDPGISVGTEVNCDNAVDRQVLTPTVTANGGAVGEFDSPNGTRTGLFQTLSNISVPAPFFDFTSLSEAVQFNGRSFFLVFKVTAGTDTVEAVKRINVTNKTSDFDTNPDETNFKIFFDDVEVAQLTALPTAVAQVNATNAAASEQSFTLKSSDGSVQTFTEDLFVSWFLSDATLEKSRTFDEGKVELTPATTAPAGRNAVIVGVAHDGRGGTAVKVFELSP